MFKTIPQKIVFFDLETIPDLDMGRRLYAPGEDVSDEGALALMSLKNGASPENPTPFLKPMFHKVIVAGALFRSVRGVNGQDVALKSLTQPESNGAPASEKEMIQRLLDFAGKNQAQLIGWNSDGFDFPVLIQRALINGCVVPDICKRPDKPWMGNDYFANFSDARLDMMKVLAGEGNYQARMKLSEMAVAMGLPGKDGMDGSKVYQAWKDGRLPEIIQYCNGDVRMTYQIWLRAARMAGMLSDEQVKSEERQLASLVDDDLPF